MKLVIVGPDGNGEGPYYLLTEDGEVLFSHYCSSSGYAEGDLIGRRPERQANLDKRWPEGWRVATLQEVGITLDELMERNKVWAERVSNERNA